MTEALIFVAGLIAGGTMTAIMLCCLQINRINEYQAEIRRLRDKYGDE